MNSQPNTQITRYDKAGRESALLRWSLWIAQGRSCYICEEKKPFWDFQIDHVIPKSLAPNQFSAVWTRVAGGLPDAGPHDINNLRACCSHCNSTRLKGEHELSDGLLGIYLARSARITTEALKEQKRLRKNRELAEAIVRITASSSNEDFKLLWDTELNQAILSTLYVAADVSLDEPTWERRGSINYPYLVRCVSTTERTRFLAALQLVSGTDLETLIDTVIEKSTSQLDLLLSEHTEDVYSGLRGPNAGDVDWSGHEFTIEWAGGTIDDDSCTCDAYVVLDTVISHQVSIQSQDGSELIDIDSPELTIEGHLFVEVSFEAGRITSVSVDDDRARVNARGADIEEFEFTLD